MPKRAREEYLYAFKGAPQARLRCGNGADPRVHALAQELCQRPSHKIDKAASVALPLVVRLQAVEAL